MKLYILLLLLFLNGTSYALTLNNNKDTVLALGMEMSNMRSMLESYIMIGAKIDYKNPTKKLKDGITHYEDLLSSIKKKYPNDKTIQESITLSQHAWKNVKVAMQLALRDESLKKLKKGAIFIHGHIRTVIKEMAYMKKYLLSKSKIKNKEALNASIEIAASARRLSAHYMMDLWHLDDPTIEKHWNKGLKIYADSIKILKESPYIYNKEFKKLLYYCTKYHKYFVKMGKKAKIYSILVDKKAEIVFENAKKMTQIILDTDR